MDFDNTHILEPKLQKYIVELKNSWLITHLGSAATPHLYIIHFLYDNNRLDESNVTISLII